MGVIKDIRSWRTGFELGLAGFAYPYAKPREPTAYLYNGVRLPALPEWDRVKYPYAFIYKRYSPVSRAYVCDLVALPEVAYAYMSSGGWAVYVGDVDRLGWRVIADSAGNFSTEWQLLETAWNGYVAPPGLTWANFGVLNEDGTVYLAASEPVPVYE